MTEEELKHWGKLGMHWGKKKAKLPDSRKTGQKVTDYLLVGSRGSKKVVEYMNKGDKHSRALLKAMAPQLGSAAVGVGLLTYSTLKANPQIIKAGVKSVQNLLLKYGSKNIYTNAGEIILNPRNYTVVREATRFLR